MGHVFTPLLVCFKAFFDILNVVFYWIFKKQTGYGTCMTAMKETSSRWHVCISHSKTSIIAQPREQQAVKYPGESIRNFTGFLEDHQLAEQCFVLSLEPKSCLFAHLFANRWIMYDGNLLLVLYGWLYEIPTNCFLEDAAQMSYRNAARTPENGSELACTLWCQ